MNTELVFGSHFIEQGDSFDGPLPSPTIIPSFDFLGNPIQGANISSMKLIGVIGASLASGGSLANNLVTILDQGMSGGLWWFQVHVMSV